MNSSHRKYEAIAQTVRRETADADNVHRQMQIVVDALWDGLHTTGVSWVGFYLDQPGEPDDRRLILGPCRNKPACSPIGLHGLCGRAFVSGRTCIVADVRTLGSSYIACDPRDQSEIVLPLIDSAGRVWGVLDLDSWDVGSFRMDDDRGLRHVLVAAGLLPSPAELIPQ